MTESTDFTWYKNRFEVVWEDGEKEVVESHHEHQKDSLSQYRSRVKIRKKDEFDVEVLPYWRPWITKKNVKVKFRSSTTRVLNFERVKSIEHISSEAIEETIEE